MSRNRLEDLGRLAERLNKILEDEIWDLYGYNGRIKDFDDWFDAQTKEKQGEILHSIAYGLKTKESELYACLAIAEGNDELNLDDKHE